MTRIRLILISENVLTRSAIAAMIARQPDLQVMAEIGSYAEVIRVGVQLRPDIFVIDVPAVRQETMDVVQRLTTLRRGTPTPVLILAGTSGDYVFDLLRLGSCTLIARDARQEELIAGIRMVAAGYVLVERRHAARLASAVRRFSYSNDAQGHLVEELTGRERDVLGLLALGLPNTEIARNLSVANSTVKSHVKEIYRKLGLRSRLEAVIFATGGEFSPSAGSPLR